jgi:hypothetical protein
MRSGLPWLRRGPRGFVAAGRIGGGLYAMRCCEPVHAATSTACPSLVVLFSLSSFWNSSSISFLVCRQPPRRGGIARDPIRMNVCVCWLDLTKATKGPRACTCRYGGDHDDEASRRRREKWKFWARWGYITYIRSDGESWQVAGRARTEGEDACLNKSVAYIIHGAACSRRRREFVATAGVARTTDHACGG